MTPNAPAPPRPRTPLGLVAAAVVLSLALLSARAAVAGTPPPPTGVAVAGPVPMASDITGLQPEAALEAPAQPAVVAPLTPAQPVQLQAIVAGDHVVPILTYHYVLDVPANTRDVMLFNLSVSPALFAEQMALLHAEGATPISFGTLMDALAGRRALPAHPVVLTFDDGYVDFATAAAPVLMKYGFVATDYVVSGFIGHSGYMSANQVTQMDALGMVIGSHTVHHVDLARMPAGAAQAEIAGGKAALEALLHHQVVDFAYPYGGFNATVEQLVRAAGFREAVSTVGGSLQRPGAAFELHRTGVGGALSLAAYAACAGLPPPTPAVYAEIAREIATAPSPYRLSRRTSG